MELQCWQPPKDGINHRACGPEVVAAYPEIRVYAEIGVNCGNTTARVAEAMAEGGTLHLFDFEDMLEKAMAYIREHGLASKHKYVLHSNTRKLKDSYNWSLLRMIERSCEQFHYVFLDGAHTWDVDTLAFFLIDQMLARKGFFELDDCDWVQARSPTMSAAAFLPMADWYTDEQMNMPHIARIIRQFVLPTYDVVKKDRLFRKR